MATQEFISVPVTPEHAELVNYSKERIAKFYGLSPQHDFIVKSALVKEIEGSGCYYKFTVEDCNNKTAIVNIDKLKPPADRTMPK